MIEIDGSYGEGGGQVLRTSLTLATLLGQPVHIHRVRAGRRNPGLAPQHLAGVVALAQVCAAEVQGTKLGSTEVIFQPGSAPQPGDYTFDVAQATRGGSAGSTALLFQTLLLPLSFAPVESHVVLKGGTHVPWSPPYDYLAQVYLSAVSGMGIDAECHLRGWGFYPAGGGQIGATIRPTGGLSPQTLLERGKMQRVRGRAVACNLPADIAQRIANRARNVLQAAGLPTEITPERVRGTGPGAGLFLVADYEHAQAGFSALGDKGKPSDQVADEACLDLLAHHATGAPVDPHLADQVLLPMSLADGHSEFRTSQITRHLLTNAYIIRQFLPVAIEIEGKEGAAGIVLVEGTVDREVHVRTDE